MAMRRGGGITGLILAGGAGRRVGGRDKGLIPWAGKPLAQQVVERIGPQVDSVIISCNRNSDLYRQFTTRTVCDTRPGYPGPLAGIEAAHPYVDTDLLLVVNCDMPLLPAGLARRLAGKLRESSRRVEICYAHDGLYAHYLCAVLHRDCLASVTGFLDNGGRAVRAWYKTRKALAVDFSDQRNAVANLNTNL